MMMTLPSAPGGAAAADPTLPGTASGAAAPASVDGQEMAVQPLLFAQLLDLAGLNLVAPVATDAEPPAMDGTDTAVADDVGQTADGDALAAMLPTTNLFAFPAMQAAVLQPAPAVQPGTRIGTGDIAGKDGTLHVAVATGGATQQSAVEQTRLATAAISLPTTAATAAAASNAAAMTAAASATTPSPALLRMLQGLQSAAAPVGRPAATEARQVVAGSAPTGAGAGTHAAASSHGVTPNAVLAATVADGNAAAKGDGSSGHADPALGFRNVMAASAPVAAADSGDAVKLAGSADQWQQPLRAALGDRLQLQLQKGSEQAVIRLDPPNLGSIEISIRHSAGSLQVHIAASNNEVLRQLNAIGDAMRQDLSQRQPGDVAVTVASTANRSLADSEGRGRQPEREQQQQQRDPGRALSEADEAANTTFAMLRE